MPDFYIPGLPENLQGLLYTPDQGQAETKRLRMKHAGNPAMQQKLVPDDRYWQGREMAQDNPLAALGALIGSVPYDAAKFAYFNGPKPVRQGLEQLTEKLFPGEAFNGQTTSRPSRAGTGAQMQGTAEGTYGYLRDKLEALNSMRVPEPVSKAVSAFTEHANYQPTLANRLMGDDAAQVRDLEQSIDMKGVPEAERPGRLKAAMLKWGAKQTLANGLDFTGTFKKAASTLLQTVNPDFETRQPFPMWMAEGDIYTMAPGYKPEKGMSPERKAAQNAQISEILKSWPAAPAKPAQFPIEQKVPLLNLGY